MTTTIEKSLIRLNQHDQDIKLLNKSIEIIADEVGKYKKADKVMDVKMVSLQTAYALSEIGRKHHGIIKGIEDARAGRFSLSVVDFRALKRAIDDLADQGSRLGKKLSIRSVLQLQNQPTSFLIQGSMVHLFVHIPYSSTDQELVLLRYLGAPMKVNKDKFYVEVEPRWEHDYIAVSKDETKHQLLTQNDLQTCHRLNQVYFCSNTLTYKSNHESCLYGLYRNDPAMVTRHCNLILTQWISKTLRVNETTVMITETNQTMLTLDCGDKHRERKIIKGSYLLTIPVGCTLSSPSMTMSRPAANVEVTLPGVMVTTPFSLQLPGDSEDWTSAVKELTSHVGEKVPLSQVKGLVTFKRQLKVAEIEGWWSGLWQVLPHSLVIFLTIVIVIVVLYCGFRYGWKRCQKKPPKMKLRRMESEEMLQMRSYESSTRDIHAIETAPSPSNASERGEVRHSRYTIVPSRSVRSE